MVLRLSVNLAIRQNNKKVNNFEGKQSAFIMAHLNQPVEIEEPYIHQQLNGELQKHYIRFSHITQQLSNHHDLKE